jgi:hypothetical protein
VVKIVSTYPERAERLPDLERDRDRDLDRDLEGDLLPRELLERTEPASEALSEKTLASESDMAETSTQFLDLVLCD